jgi:uncharacterized membrane protein (GlpM family)
LVGIEVQDPSKFTPSNTRFQRGSSSIRRKYRTHEITMTTPIAGVSYIATPVMEYKRAAHVLRDQIGRKSLFLRSYALYLVSLITFLCQFLLTLKLFLPTLDWYIVVRYLNLISSWFVWKNICCEGLTP